MIMSVSFCSGWFANFVVSENKKHSNNNEIPEELECAIQNALKQF
jgi:hypothetical protein